MRSLPTNRRPARLVAPLVPALLVPALVFAAPLAQKRAKAEPRLEPFLGSLTDAKRAAAERNVPLLIHGVLEGEPQNDEYRDHVLHDAGLIALCERAVVIVANNGEHELETVKETVDERTVERKVCSAYPWFERCDQHRLCWDPIYEEFHDADGDLRCPQTIVLDPAGAIAWHRDDGNAATAGDVTAELKAAQKAAGKGLTVSELAELKNELGQGRLATKDGDPARAWRAFSAANELLASGPYGEESKAGMASALAEMQKRLAAEVARLVPGTAGAAYRALVGLAKAFVDTPLEKDAGAAVRDAEKRKDVSEEVDAAKLEMEAEELWNEAQELEKAGEAKKAERVIRRLLRKRYASTEVAKALRAKYPEWAAEEDAKGK